MARRLHIDPSMNTLTNIEDRARTMTDAELWHSRMDAVKTAEAMDALDRVDDLDRAGRYRDEAGIYWTELKRRGAR